LGDALNDGQSKLKSLHIIGDYDGGNFVSSEPFTLTLHHADINGILQISDGAMRGKMNLILRGTSPMPAPISIDILPNGARRYSLSQIMPNFDVDYFRDFATNHDKW
jgi:hypothetical protein